MNCEEALELLSARLDGELPPEEAERLQAHLAVCPACRAVEAAYGALNDDLAALAEEPPAALCENVMAAVRRERQTARSRRRGGVAVAAAAAALLLVLGVTRLPALQSDPAARPATVSLADAGTDGAATQTRELPEEASAQDGAAVAPSAANAPTSFAVTAQTAPSSAVEAAFPDGVGVPELLVELLDDPDAPAADQVAELSNLTAEATAADWAVLYESDAETVRQIVDVCRGSYQMEIPEALADAADADPCAILVVAPES